MKVVIAGGGTGGHLFPALAVAEVLQERKHEVVILISEKEIDALATRDRSEFRFEKLPTVGMPNLFSFAIFGFMKRLNESLAPCRALYNRFQPDAVLGMGGFTSTSPILAGRLRRVPTFVHESNAIPGKANRLNARLSNVVLLGFEECARFFPKSKCKVTGTPIRKSLLARVPKEQARAAFGLQPERKTLLVMGGSQGAHGINELLIKAAPALAREPVQIIHLTGPQDEQLVTANYRRENIPAHVSAFHHRMEEAYSAADVAVARSGAASLTELSHFRLPSILIPYPFAADDHQTANAKIFERAGASILTVQSETTPESLAEKLRALISDPARLDAMSAACARLAPEDAAGKIVDILEGYSKC
jgi:UDP-N-acetylglucosamine--N-acetylmuramyl-(pentapeptide) pyrophosphoryl-undecaprenol N-acetylglucosamine transferase